MVYIHTGSSILVISFERTKQTTSAGMVRRICSTHVIFYGPRIFIEDALVKDTIHYATKPQKTNMIR